MKEFFAFVGVVLGVIVVGSAFVIVATYPLAERSCHSKWVDSGHATDFGLFSGCRVQLSDGTWVPEERLINMRASD